MAVAAAGLFTAEVGLMLAGRHNARARHLLSLALGLRALNGVTHIGETLVMRRYVPGVVTSPAVIAAALLARSALSK